MKSATPTAAVDVCYIVSHGFASRMITQTDLLGRLQAQGLSTAVICPDRKDPVLSRYCAERGITLVEFQPRTSLFNEDYLVKRHYYLEDIRANQVLWEKHLAATRFHPARNPLRRVRPYWYYLMYRLNHWVPQIRERFRAREKEFLHSPEAERLLAGLKPRNLVATYPVTLGEAMLLHYGNRSPDTSTWIHLLSWDNITCKGRFAETADRYVAWGEVMRDEFVEHYGIDPARIHLCGVPHFDVHRDPAIQPLVAQVVEAAGLSAQRPYIVFAMSSPRFAPNEIGIVEWLAQKVAAGAYGAVQLLVRPHPQNVSGNMADPSWLPRLQALSRLPGVAVALPKLVESRMRWSMAEQDMYELAAMLAGAALVLNSGSTVSIDALMHHKPVLITSFDGEQRREYWNSARRLMDYPHLRKLRELGGVEVATDLASCDERIRALLASPGQGADRRRAALLAECFSDDGHATSRVVETFAAFARSEGAVSRRDTAPEIGEPAARHACAEQLVEPS